LGYVYDNATKKELERFILNEFIFPNNHLLPNTHIHKNQWAQLRFLCKQYYDTKPKLIATIDADKINTISIQIKDEILATNSSISYKYAKKKSINEALKKVVLLIETKTTETNWFIENEKIRLQNIENQKLAEKEAKQQKHKDRIQKHADKMAEKCRVEAIKAAQTDKKRREVKQNLKEKTSKKGAATIYRDYSAEEIAAMSVSKRRNLQDRGIIPK